MNRQSENKLLSRLRKQELRVIAAQEKWMSAKRNGLHPRKHLDKCSAELDYQMTIFRELEKNTLRSL